MNQSTETHLKPFRLLLSVLLAVLLVTQMGIAAFASQAQTETKTEDASQQDHCKYKIDLSVQEYDQPGLEEMLFNGIPTQRYYLLLDSQMLVASDDAQALTELVMNVARSYVNENTVSCRLENPKQVHLCYGQVSFLTSADLKGAANTLQERLCFITEDQVVEEESIPYEREQVEDPERYEDLPPVVTEGKEGLKQIITKTTYRNGEQTEQQTTEQVAQQPVNEITTVGTKPRVEYIWPTDGRVSSGFGIRHIKVGSRNHKGIDIAVPKGTDILASKSGVVSFAGRNGGYGNLVKIDHGDGTETYYGHNSQLLVQKGDYVEQGDLIAYAGSTGLSTGPHCHFEIRIDGKAVNPIEYLPEK